MKKIVIVIISLVIVSKLSAQFNAGLNINYCYPISKTPSRLGYNVLIGYSIKKKIDINLKTENAVVIGSLIDKELKMNSFQLELKYYLIGIESLINPYISTGSGYFIRTIGESTETAIGILPSIGALFNIQESKKRLYLNTQLAYCYVNTSYPNTTLNFNIGLLYYFKNKSETSERK